MFSQYFCKHWDWVDIYKCEVEVKILCKRISDGAMHWQYQPLRY